jgi:hypothetical protein
MRTRGHARDVGFCLYDFANGEIKAADSTNRSISAMIQEIRAIQVLPSPRFRKYPLFPAGTGMRAFGRGQEDPTTEVSCPKGQNLYGVTIKRIAHEDG